MFSPGRELASILRTVEKQQWRRMKGIILYLCKKFPAANFY
jgi:hypothetical protein